MPRQPEPLTAQSLAPYSNAGDVVVSFIIDLDRSFIFFPYSTTANDTTDYSTPPRPARTPHIIQQHYTFPIC